MQGRPPPSETMMHSPYFRFPLFSKNFQTLWKIFEILPFPEFFFDFPIFIRRNLVIDHEFRICSLFSPFQYISPLFRENYSFPLLLQISHPVFEKFPCFLHALCVFRFPPTLTMMHLCITQCTYWTSLYIWDFCNESSSF